MKEIKKMDIQTQNAMQKGAAIYNSLRSSIIMSYGQLMSSEDKKWLAMYLGLIQSENFFSELLKQLKYDTYIDYELRQSTSNNYDEEFYKGFRSFISENCLEIITLFLLEQPVIRDLNEKTGYSRVILKTAIYDRMSQNLPNEEKTMVKTQKVLTK